MIPPQPIRILYCENNADGTIGGSYYSLLYLVKGLDRSRYRPTVVFYTDHALIPAFREAGIETLVWRRPVPFTFGHRLASRVGRVAMPFVVLQKGLNLGRAYVLGALSRAWFLKTRGIKVVHLNNSILYNHDWMLAARLVGARCLTHERGIREAYPATARFFGRRLDAVVCISDAVRKNMQARGADFGNLTTIHNGLDPCVMRVKIPPLEMRRRYGLDEQTPVVVMTGNIRSWKGQDTLVRAIDIVRRQFPSVRCLLVGDTSRDDVEYERKLRQLVAALGLEEHVIFTGYQSNVADFVSMSDVVVHASVLPEPFGRVVLEAMACEKPVIGARAGAIPEIVEEGKTGLMFAPGAHEGLAAAIARLLGNHDEAKRLGANGYQRLLAQFHVDRNVAATERIYEALLGASR